MQLSPELNKPLRGDKNNGDTGWQFAVSIHNISGGGYLTDVGRIIYCWKNLAAKSGESRWGLIRVDCYCLLVDAAAWAGINAKETRGEATLVAPISWATSPGIPETQRTSRCPTGFGKPPRQVPGAAPANGPALVAAEGDENLSNAALKNKKKREAKKAKDADAKDWTDQPPQQAIQAICTTRVITRFFSERIRSRFPEIAISAAYLPRNHHVT
jgi:hypothetical protein